MRRRIFIIAAVLITCAWASLSYNDVARAVALDNNATPQGQQSDAPQGEARPGMPEYAPGEVLVKFREGVDPQIALRSTDLGSASISRIHSIKPAVARFKKDYKLEKTGDGWYSFLGKNYKEVADIPDEEVFREAYSKMPETEKSLYRSYKIALPGGVSVEEAVSRLKNDPDVEYAEPNYLSRTFYLPNDALYSSQWSHVNTQAALGWDITRGGPDVVIAIIDTGVDYNHEDLAVNIRPGKDFVDIDTDAYKRELYTLIPEEDYKDIDDEPMDHNGHGTHCAGIAGAAGNNGLGIAGVAHNCKIMPVRAGFSICSPTEYGIKGAFENDDIANAVVYAADNGADVISMSFGSIFPSRSMKNSLDYAAARGVVLVAAAGNGGDSLASYPAAFDNVIAVGATDQNDYTASFSTRGSWVDISAPGVDILSTVPKTGANADQSGYKKMSGTSMACPYIAGVAALIKSNNPDWTPDKITKALFGGAQVIRPGYDYYYGYGRINIFNALRADLPSYALAKIITPDIGGKGYRQYGGTVDITGMASGSNFSSYKIEVRPTQSYYGWTTRGVALNNAGSKEILEGHLGKWDSSSFADGLYVVKLSVYNSATADNSNIGTSYDEKTVTILVNNIIPVRQGWPQGAIFGPSPYLSSPVLADLDGDKALEILTGSYEGLVYAWNHDGTNVDGWPVCIGREGAMTPSVGDIDGDGNMEVVVGVYSSNYSGQDDFYYNRLFVFNNDGTPYPGAWPKRSGPEYIRNEVLYVWQPPILSDMDNDGDLEIIIGDAHTKMRAWHHTGEPVAGWPIDLRAQKITAAAGDIDQDGKPEIVTLEGSTSGRVSVWKSDGTPVGGIWPRSVGMCLYAPAIGDIDGDNKNEIVVNSASGLYVFDERGYTHGMWPKTSADKYDKCLGDGAPILGDLDGDGKLEVILAATGHQQYASKLWVFKGDGTTFGNWPYKFGKDYYIPYKTFGANVADINGDGKQEIVVMVYSYSDGAPSMFVFKGDGSLLPGYPKRIDVDHNSIQALGDLEANGSLQMAAFGYWNEIIPTPFYMYEIAGYCPKRKMDWPMLGQNPRHTNSCPFPNRPPQLQPVTAQSVREGELLTIPISATDFNNDILTYSMDGAPRGAQFDGSAFVWRPGYDQAGVYQVTFNVSDGEYTDSKTVVITVINVNRPPVITVAPAGDKSVNEGEELRFNVTATDPDGDTLTYSTTGLPQGAKFEDRTFTWTPTYYQSGTYNMTFVVSDGTLTSSETVTITVTDVNGPPEITPIPDVTAIRHQLLRFTVKAIDPDNDRITYSVRSKPHSSNFNKKTGVFSWVPRLDQGGVHKIAFTAKDSFGNQSSKEVTITVQNQAPVLSPIGDKTVRYNRLLHFKATAKDPDPIDRAHLRFYSERMPKGANLSHNGIFTWVPSKKQTGTYAIKVRVTDPSGLSDEETILISVR